MERPGFESSDSWKELENIQYNETAKTFYNSENTVLKPGIDYGHPKIVNFDDLIAPRGYVITGVRLGFAVDKFKKPDLEAAAIELHIRVTPFDYNTGKLINLTQTHWIVPEYTSRFVCLRYVSVAQVDSSRVRERLNLGMSPLPKISRLRKRKEKWGNSTQNTQSGVKTENARGALLGTILTTK